MKRLAGLTCILAVAGLLLTSTASAQTRAVVGVGIGLPVGDFGDEAGAGAQSGGGTALLGVEWLPRDATYGVRVDGAWNRFCTAACNAAGGDLDVRYRFLNLNLNGLLELPLASSEIRPYLIAGAGLYNYRLEGDDVPGAAAATETDLGINGGLGLTYMLGRVGIYAEGRLHNVFATERDIQYIPVMLGARINLQ